MPRFATQAELTYRPQVLYEASIERIREAESALAAAHWVLAMYLAGLAVECVLQAVALRWEPFTTLITVWSNGCDGAPRDGRRHYTANFA